MSIRKALTYSGCSKNTYYGNKDHRNDITAATAATAATIMIEKEIQQISLQRPTYGTRRMAAMLTRVSGRPINRKRVQRIFRKTGYITPSKKKREILRSKVPFQNYQEAELAIKDAFVDYNQNGIHSALRYMTPYEFISKWKMQQQIIEEKEREKVINIG